MARQLSSSEKLGDERTSTSTEREVGESKRRSVIGRSSRGLVIGDRDR